MAQLDRARDYGSRGWGFDSLWARHLKGIMTYFNERILRVFMEEAIEEAQKAFYLGEVPVGAVIVDREYNIVARAHNLRETLGDPTAHAEILAIREASKKLGDWRLEGCSIFVTLEPCLMCAGAIIQSRLDYLFFGARDPKAGAVVSLYRVLDDPRFNHKVHYLPGILEKRAFNMLKSFFSGLRSRNRGEVAEWTKAGDSKSSDPFS